MNSKHGVNQEDENSNANLTPHLTLLSTPFTFLNPTLSRIGFLLPLWQPSPLHSKAHQEVKTPSSNRDDEALDQSITPQTCRILYQNFHINIQHSLVATMLLEALS